MDEIILDSGTGWFSLNNDIYPTGHYRIVAQGENIIVLNTDNKPSFQAHSSQFVDTEGTEIGGATDILNSLKAAAFKKGGGDGSGVTTDASELTSGTLNPARIGNGSIEEEKLSEEVRERLVKPNNIQALVSKIESTINNNPRIEGIMENPPIITQTNGSPESGLTEVYRAAEWGSLISQVPFTYMGGRPKVYGGEYVRFPAVKLAETGGNVDDGENAYAWRIGFNTDAPKISMGFLSGLTYRFIVDGQYVSLDRTSLGSGQPTYITLDFSSVGGRKVREIMIEGVAAAGFHSIALSPVDTIWKMNEGYRLSVVGQSYEQGTGASYINDGYVPIMGDLLGFSDVRQIAEGGTGYTVGASKYIDRISDWTGGNIPDLLVLSGALADVSSGVNELRDAVIDLIQQTRIILPKLPIVTLAIMPAATGPSQIYLDKENEIREAVESLNDPLIKFIPISTDPTGSWLTGTGFENSPNGTGNSDIYLGGVDGSDSTHPNDLGHQYLGTRAAKAILKALKEML